MRAFLRLIMPFQGPINLWQLPARVAELVDALDLGSSAARRESSSLTIRTKILSYRHTLLNDISLISLV